MLIAQILPFRFSTCWCGKTALIAKTVGFHRDVRNLFFWYPDTQRGRDSQPLAVTDELTAKCFLSESPKQVPDLESGAVKSMY